MTSPLLAPSTVTATCWYCSFFGALLALHFSRSVCRPVRLSFFLPFPSDGNTKACATRDEAGLDADWIMRASREKRGRARLGASAESSRQQMTSSDVPSHGRDPGSKQDTTPHQPRLGWCGPEKTSERCVGDVKSTRMPWENAIWSPRRTVVALYKQIRIELPPLRRSHRRHPGDAVLMFSIRASEVTLWGYYY